MGIAGLKQPKRSYSINNYPSRALPVVLRRQHASIHRHVAEMLNPGGRFILATSYTNYFIQYFIE